VPGWLWKWLATHVEVGCCERAADLEFFVLWRSAFVLISLIAALAYACVFWSRKFFEPATEQPSVSIVLTPEQLDAVLRGASLSEESTLVVMLGEYPALEELIGDWLQEDGMVSWATIENAALKFKRASPHLLVRQACSEMDAFLEKYGAHADIAFAQFFESFDPAELECSIPEFFKELQRILNN